MDHRDPSLRLVRDLRLAAESHNLGVVDHARDHARDGIGEDLRVGVDAEDHLEPIRRDSRTPPHRVEELVLERRHALVEHDLLEEAHEEDLRIPLASVSGLRVARFGGVPDLGDEHHRNALLLALLDRVIVVLVEAGEDLGAVVPLVSVRDGDVRQGFDVVRNDDELLHHAQRNLGRRERVAGALDHAVGDDDEDFVRVGVVGRRERVERRAETFDGFRVGGDEEDGVGEGVVERLKVGGRLRDDVAEGEGAGSHDAVGEGGSSRMAALELSNERALASHHGYAEKERTL